MGHTAPQWSHPIHHPPLTTSVFLFFISRTKLGQTVTHSPQLIHLLSSTLGGSILNFKNPFPPSNFVLYTNVKRDNPCTLIGSGQECPAFRTLNYIFIPQSLPAGRQAHSEFRNRCSHSCPPSYHLPISLSPYLPILYTYSLTPLKVLRWSSQMPNFSIASRCSFVP